jgi:hypothetical protein
MIIRLSFFPKEYPVYISYHEVNEDMYNLLLYIFNEIVLENFIGKETFNNGNTDIDIIENTDTIKNYLKYYGEYQFDLLKHILNNYNNQLEHSNDILLKSKIVEYYSDTESSELKLSK